MAIVVSTSPDVRPRSAAQLVDKVGRIFGAVTDTDRAACLDYLNEQIIKLNSKLYECNRVETDVISIVNGADTSIGALFFKEEEFYVCDSAGVKIRQLEYRDWAEFTHTFDLSNASGPPFAYTLFNAHATGKIRLLPLVPATPASTLYVKGSYYKRFALLADLGSVIDAPQEIENALVYGAQAEALMIHAPASPILTAKMLEAREAWDRFIVSDGRHPDKRSRFRLAPLSRTIGTGYIRI